MKTPASTRPGNSRHWWIAGALFLSCLVAVVAIRLVGAQRLRAAVDRIALEGQALTPAYLPIPKNEGKLDPSEWFARVARSRPQWDMTQVSDPSKYPLLLDEARTNRMGEDARLAFEAFDAALRVHLEGAADQAAQWNEFWVALAVRLRECDGVRPWTDRERSAVRLIAVGLGNEMLLARQAAAYGVIDPVRESAALEGPAESFPKLPFVQEARLADAIHVTTLNHVQSGRAGEALDTLRSGFAIARIHSTPRWLMSEMMWTLQMTRVLDGMQTILPMLPRGLDLADFEAAFTEARPRESMAMAIRGERAFGYRVFERLREGAAPHDVASLAPRSFLSDLRGMLVGDFDRARYLDTLTTAALRAEQSRYLRQPAIDGVPDSFWTPIASIVAPQLEPSLASSDRLEARLALARVALVAYRQGAKDALEFLSKSTDPFDGRPIRCGLGDTGLVVFWSAGSNGKDDGALPDTDDIVWGLKLRD